MQSCFSEILDDVLQRAAEGLVRDRGIPFVVQGTDGARRTTDEDVAALVSFHGEKLRGSLMLLSTFDTAASTRAPSLSSTPVSSKVSRDWILIRDWVGELTNQLVGRVKNRLLAFGVELVIATPVPLSGRGLSLAVHGQRNARTIAFGRGRDVLWIVVSLLEEPPLVSTRPRVDAENPAREGDIIEF